MDVMLVVVVVVVVAVAVARLSSIVFRHTCTHKAKSHPKHIYIHSNTDRDLLRTPDADGDGVVDEEARTRKQR